jgi:hypothetical protein
MIVVFSCMALCVQCGHTAVMRGCHANDMPQSYCSEECMEHCCPIGPKMRGTRPVMERQDDTAFVQWVLGTPCGKASELPDLEQPEIYKIFYGAGRPYLESGRYRRRHLDRSIAQRAETNFFKRFFQQHQPHRKLYVPTMELVVHLSADHRRADLALSPSRSEITAMLARWQRKQSHHAAVLMVVLEFEEGYDTHNHYDDLHSNVVVLHRPRREISYFEPHGCGAPWVPLVADLLRSVLMLPEYEFLPPAAYCPAVAWQDHEDAADGLCLFWSMLYATLRMGTSAVPSRYLVDRVQQMLVTETNTRKVDQIMPQFTCLLWKTLHGTQEYQTRLAHAKTISDTQSLVCTKCGVRTYDRDAFYCSQCGTRLPPWPLLPMFVIP